MAPSVKCLLHKRETLKPTPTTMWKSQAQKCHPRAGDTETGGSPTPGQLGQHAVGSARDPASKTRENI